MSGKDSSSFMIYQNTKHTCAHYPSSALVLLHFIDKAFLSSPCLLSCSASCCQMKTTTDKKQVDCVRHKADRVTTQEEKSYVFMRTGDNDKDKLDSKLTQSGSSALFTERRGFYLPGFSFLQNFCRFYRKTLFLVVQPQCTQQLHSQEC